MSDQTKVEVSVDFNHLISEAWAAVEYGGAREKAAIRARLQSLYRDGAVAALKRVGSELTAADRVGVVAATDHGSGFCWMDRDGSSEADAEELAEWALKQEFNV